MLYMTNERYESARKIYQSIGVDTEAALDRLRMCRYQCIAGREMM